MAKSCDLAILGGGPGGYVAAIRAAQLGISSCLVEMAVPGGVCLNWGCIPSKSLIHQASQFRALAEMEAVGVAVDRKGLDYRRVQSKSREAAETLARGVAALLKKNKVDVVTARGVLAGPGRIALSGGEAGGSTVEAKNIIIATGSRPLRVPGFAIDEKVVLSSTGALALTVLPKSMAILGAGAIGCEFAFVMNAFGVRVTLVEMAPHILPTEDHEVAAVLEASLRRSGIDVRTNTRALGFRESGAEATVDIETAGKPESIRAEKILAAFGRTPNTDGIGLDIVGLAVDKTGRIITDAHSRTTVPGIYAVGDVTTTPALAHVASKEGEIAVEHIAGRPIGSGIDPDLIPSAVYCEPQVAGFGLREDRAKREGVPYTASVFPYRGAGKSVAIGKTTGLVKILAAPDTGEILGAHIVGHDATELIHELLLAKAAELTTEDVAGMMHAHPTLAEAVMEAARGVDGRPIHL